MVRNVLIVDDDQEMLLSLKEGLQKYDETFSVILAGDGQIAMEKLERNSIAMVVTDLKMPRINGFTLLSHIMEEYPDIPVIIITAYSTPEMEKLAHSGGAVGYIEKPFMVEDLAKRIMATLRKETEGGTLHGVSSGMFLQLIEMEQKTCTIRVIDKASEKQGVLFFREGQLYDARVNGSQGVKAAYEIFSWEEVTLSIQNGCAQKNKRIDEDLQAILLEAMRLKDEAVHRGVESDKPETSGDVDEGDFDEVVNDGEAARLGSAEEIRLILKEEVGDSYELEERDLNVSWRSLFTWIGRLEPFFGKGNFKVGYVDRGDPTDFLLLTDDEPRLFSIDPNCQKEKVLRVLSRK